MLFRSACTDGQLWRYFSPRATSANWGNNVNKRSIKHWAKWSPVLVDLSRDMQ